MRQILGVSLLLCALALLATYFLVVDRADEDKSPSPRGTPFRSTYVPKSMPEPERFLAGKTPEGAPADEPENHPSPPLEILLREAPSGNTGEWLASRYATDPDAPHTQAWLVSLLTDTVGMITIDEPPLVVDIMFGPSDRAWLEKFKARFLSDLNDAKRLASGSGEGAWVQQYEDIKARYRRGLIEVATARFNRNQELQARLNDTQLLRDLPDDSVQRRWLERMTSRLGTEILWSWHGIDQLKPSGEMLKNISGADLIRIQRWVMDARRDLTLRGNPALGSDAAKLAVEPYAEQFRAMLDSR